MAAGLEPNAENKLFVGGCPPGSGEEDLRTLFEKHGHVEEVFVMRGGSRSGMACAFIRFGTQQMAQAAIDAIHGQHTLPNAAEPLVVRWADAPGTRKRDSREGSRKRGGGGGSAGGACGSKFNMGNGWRPMMPMQMPMNWAGYPPMQQVAMQQQMAAQHQAAMGGSYASGFYPSQGGAAMGMGGNYCQQQMMAYPQMVPYLPQAGMPQCWEHSPHQQPIPSGMMGQLPPPMHLSPSMMDGQQGAYSAAASLM